MSLDPRMALGRWRAAEAAIELSVPALAALLSWVLGRGVLAAPTAARPLTTMEVGALFLATSALTGWMAGRQLWMAGRKGPWGAVALTSFYVAVALLVLPGLVTDGFAASCEAAKGPWSPRPPPSPPWAPPSASWAA